MPLVKLVFGAQFERTRLSEYAAALSYAKRCGQTADTVAGFIESRDGGIKGCVAAERAARRAEKSSRPEAPLDKAKRLLRDVPAIGEVSQTDAAGTAEFVIMLGRRTPDRAGTVRILRVLDEKPSVVDAIVKRAAKSVAAGPAAVFEPLNPDLKSTNISLPPWPWSRRRSSGAVGVRRTPTPLIR